MWEQNAWVIITIDPASQGAPALALDIGNAAQWVNGASGVHLRQLLRVCLCVPAREQDCAIKEG
jgi:hypothetical protein